MRITDAFWEKRNLNVSTAEVNVDPGDNEKDVYEMLSFVKKYEYIVVKVPQTKFDIYTKLFNEGFVFAESILNMQLQIKDSTLTSNQKRYLKEIGYDIMQKSDIDFLVSELKKGIFESDRIFLDPKFSKEIALNRYVNWIFDEVDKGIDIYKILYKTNSIGFFTLKRLDEVKYYPFLGALYSKYTNSGLGFSVVRMPIEEVQKRNGKMISTFVSSNNLPIIRAHIQQGYNVAEINNVFIKHN